MTIYAATCSSGLCCATVNSSNISSTTLVSACSELTGKWCFNPFVLFILLAEDDISKICLFDLN